MYYAYDIFKCYYFSEKPVVFFNLALPFVVNSFMPMLCQELQVSCASAIIVNVRIIPIIHTDSFKFDTCIMDTVTLNFNCCVYISHPFVKFLQKNS